MKVFKKSILKKKDKEIPPYPTEQPFIPSDVSSSINFIKQIHEREYTNMSSNTPPLSRRTTDDFKLTKPSKLATNQVETQLSVANSPGSQPLVNSTNMSDTSIIDMENIDPLNVSTIQRQDQITQYITNTIDGMNIGPAGEFLKTVLIALTKCLLSSKYINSTPSSQIHLQSFLYGVFTTSLVLFISPFLSVYLDSWVVLLIRLFKHIIGWLVAGFCLHYVIRSKQPSLSLNTQSGLSLQAQQSYIQQPQAQHKYEQLQYSVKHTNNKQQPQNNNNRTIIKLQQQKPSLTSTTPPPPRAQNRPRPLPNSPNKQEAYHYQAFKDHNGNALRRRDDSSGKRPISNYDKFINAAYEQQRKDLTYERFVTNTAKIEPETDEYLDFQYDDEDDHNEFNGAKE